MGSTILINSHTPVNGNLSTFVLGSVALWQIERIANPRVFGQLQDLPILFLANYTVVCCIGNTKMSTRSIHEDGLHIVLESIRAWKTKSTDME